MTREGGWQPVLAVDEGSRRTKASKIVKLVEPRRPLAGARILEIGTGGGVITAMLAEHAGPDGAVVSVDVEDMRVVKEGYEFELVEGTELPFDDQSFDVIISNHTMEHVGGPDDQLVHVREIARTLRRDGLGYLASPTRWALIEPHFKMPMLSWLPPSARDRALRLSRRGTVYDVSPRTRRELRELIEQAGLEGEDITTSAVDVAAATESGVMAKLAGRAPAPLLRLSRPAMPTMVFLLRHPADADAA